MKVGPCPECGQPWKIEFRKQRFYCEHCGYSIDIAQGASAVQMGDATVVQMGDEVADTMEQLMGSAHQGGSAMSRDPVYSGPPPTEIPEPGFGTMRESDQLSDRLPFWFLPLLAFLCLGVLALAAGVYWFFLR
jgi:hypothetical protein